MALKRLKEYDQITLRDDIQGTLGNEQAIDADRNRTFGRDKTARWIVENVVRDDAWPLNATDIVTLIQDDPEYDGPTSRQHVTNTLEYFKGAEESTGSQSESQSDYSGMPTQSDSPMSAAPEIPQTDSMNPDEIESVMVLADGHYREVEIDVPDDVADRKAYVRGYLDALQF